MSSLSNLAVGTFYLLAVADYPGAVAELAKTNNVTACGPFTAARFLPSRGGATNSWQWPQDFGLEGWLREEFPDTRPGSPPPSAGVGPVALSYAGNLILQNGSLTNMGPTYTGSELVLTANVPSSAVVAETNLFGGSGTAPFSFSLDLIKGEVVRFMVFCGSTSRGTADRSTGDARAPLMKGLSAFVAAP